MGAKCRVRYHYRSKSLRYALLGLTVSVYSVHAAQLNILKKLRMSKSGKVTKSSKKGPLSPRGTQVSEKDAEFGKLFKIKNEVVVRGPTCLWFSLSRPYLCLVIACDWRKEQKRLIPGALYITQNYFCFSSDTFGAKFRQKFPLAKVSAVRLNNDAGLIILTFNDHDYVFENFEDVQGSASFLLSLHKARSSDASAHTLLSRVRFSQDI